MKRETVCESCSRTVEYEICQECIEGNHRYCSNYFADKGEQVCGCDCYYAVIARMEPDPFSNRELCSDCFAEEYRKASAAEDSDG